MNRWLWRKVAQFVSHPRVFAWIVERALKRGAAVIDRRSKTALRRARYHLGDWWLWRFEMHHLASGDQPSPQMWKFGTTAIVMRGGYFERTTHGLAQVRSVSAGSVLFHQPIGWRVLSTHMSGAWVLLWFRK